jgi:hypothetical protein
MSEPAVVPCHDFRALAQLASGPPTQVRFVMEGDAGEILSEVRKGAYLLGPPARRRGRPPGKKPLRPDQVRELRRRHTAGESLVTLALDFDLAIKSVKNVLSRKCWKDVD